MSTPLPLPPARSLVSVQPVPPEQGGGVLIGCDCGTSTHLVVEGVSHLTEPTEAAFTCSGCQSAHWFTVAPLGEAGEDR